MSLFPLDLEPNVRGGPGFKTAIVRSRDGREKRNVSQWDAGWTWTLTFEELSEEEVIALTTRYEELDGQVADFEFCRPFEDEPRVSRFDFDGLQIDFDALSRATIKIVEVFDSTSAPALPEDFPDDDPTAEIDITDPDQVAVETTYQTSVLGRKQFAEVRSASRPRIRRWNLKFNVLSHDALADLQDFFIARRGQAQTFRLRLSPSETVKVRFDTDQFDAIFDLETGAVAELPVVEVLPFTLTTATGNPMRDHLRLNVTTIAGLWRFTSVDGEKIIRWTNHTRPIEYDGDTYVPGPLDASELERTEGLDPDNLDANLVFYEGGFERFDVVNGVWTGARAEFWTVNYLNPDAGRILYRRHYFGKMKIQDLMFNVEMISLAGKLSQNIGQATTEMCRVRHFGNNEEGCFADLAPLTHEAQVTAATGTSITIDLTKDNAYFRFGEIEWLSGTNTGFKTRIKDNVGSALTLQFPPPRPAEADDEVRLIAGCARTLTGVGGCRDKINFRGEPHGITLSQASRINRA